ncbi:MAG: DUF4097 family beta strand repeat protein [Clostridia bacterium]|nr:DUF4097 family beta strand repeat protein [Clostridia bacterium]
MRTQTKIWLCIAVSLLLIGGVIFGGAMMKLNWDFTKLSTTQFVTNTYEITDAYKDIFVIIDTANLTFVPSKDGICKVVCYEEQNAQHKVAVQDGTLIVQAENEKKWYEHIGIHFDTPMVTVYMPQGAYGALNVNFATGSVEIPQTFTFDNIKAQGSTGYVTNLASATGDIKIWTSTGAIRVENVNACSLDLAVSTGKVTVSDVTCTGDVAVSVSTGKTALTNVKCAGVASDGNTGDISMKNVVAQNAVSIVRTTGDVTFDGCDAAEIAVTTDTGDVKGSLLTDKVFIAQSDTGRIRVPETTNGGKCKITTDTGDIDIHVAK